MQVTTTSDTRRKQETRQLSRRVARHSRTKGTSWGTLWTMYPHTHQDSNTIQVDCAARIHYTAHRIPMGNDTQWPFATSRLWIGVPTTWNSTALCVGQQPIGR